MTAPGIPIPDAAQPAIVALDVAPPLYACLYCHDTGYRFEFRGGARRRITLVRIRCNHPRRLSRDGRAQA